MATARKRAPRSPRKSAPAPKPINLALQGGGAHGAKVTLHNRERLLLVVQHLYESVCV